MCIAAKFMVVFGGWDRKRVQIPDQSLIFPSNLSSNFLLANLSLIPPTLEGIHYHGRQSHLLAVAPLWLCDFEKINSTIFCLFYSTGK